MSVKLKITLWYTSLMIIVVGLVLLFMSALSGSVAEDNMTTRLENFTEHNSNEVEYSIRYVSKTGEILQELELDDFVEQRSDMTSYIYNSRGELLHGDEEVYFTDLEFVDGEIRTKYIDGEKYMVYDIKSVSNPRLPNVYVWVRGVCKVDPELYSGTVGSVVETATRILPFVVIVAAICGYFISVLLLSPVKKITNAAEAISDGDDLSRRININKGRDEVHRLANTFDKMIGRLENSFEAERAFTSDASHELRTPTGVILAQCEYSLEQEQSPEEYREAIGLIRRQAKKMSSLISQLLAFTRLEMHTEKINMEQFNVGELLSDACMDMQSLAEKGITLECNGGDDIEMRGDQVLVCRIITNLISNAYKYGVENGHIWVNATEDDKYVYVSVKDDGIGISPDEQAKIFGRFYRADKSRSQVGGYGLGLALARQAAQLHGGDITVISELDKGSEFIVKLKK